jgi:hypothetical protein
VPLITVKGADLPPGALDLLTVQVVGNRERTPSWFELALAWFDPAKAVLPLDDVFPQGQTTEQRNQESAVMMVDSQKEATAAALTQLGYDVKPMVEVTHSPTTPQRKASCRRVTSSAARTVRRSPRPINCAPSSTPVRALPCDSRSSAPARARTSR